GLALAPALRGARVARADWPRVLAMALVGAALAPVALFFGLERTTAVDASLLLTLELVFTTLLAAFFLAERTRGSALAGLALLFAAALAIALASATGRAGGSTALGAFLVAAAAFGWGIDNTLSTALTANYTSKHLVALRGLIGGAATLVVALVLRPHLIRDLRAADVLPLLFIGLVGIALSTYLVYGAFRRIGATRSAALFVPATALTGALAGHFFLGEELGALHLVAAVLIVVGVVLVARSSDPNADPAERRGADDAAAFPPTPRAPR
ncbi:MAG: DMT family transporter, partial [Thermoplasmatota archaeon]